MKNQKNLSAEEKLLNIIEKRSPDDKPVLDPSGAVAASMKGPRLLIPMKGNFGLRRISLNAINKMLMVLLFLGTITLGYMFSQERSFLSIKLNEFTERKLSKSGSSGINLDKSLPSMDQYLSDTEKNNPFHILPVTIEKPIDDPDEVLELALVGIFWDDEPQAVIENVMTKRDYMVYEGDPVEHFTVEKITADSVHLVSDENEKKILR